MSSLKDALKKAGFRSTKNENERERLGPKKNISKNVQNQRARTFCEVCERTLPDVERYKHRNPMTEAQWICVGCADRLMIEDRFRVTAQSDFSKKRMFRRYYGETIKLDTNKDRKFDSNHRNKDGNRSKGPGQKGKSNYRNQRGPKRNQGGGNDDNFGNR
ncbi:MAG: hypothetical protein ACPGJV_13895 [Bacteriovoracaceae bacterium]